MFRIIRWSRARSIRNGVRRDYTERRFRWLFDFGVCREVPSKLAGRDLNGPFTCVAGIKKTIPTPPIYFDHSSVSLLIRPGEATNVKRAVVRRYKKEPTAIYPTVRAPFATYIIWPVEDIDSTTHTENGQSTNRLHSRVDHIHTHTHTHTRVTSKPAT